MNKIFCPICLAATLVLQGIPVYAGVTDYQTVTETDGKTVQIFSTDDGSGNTVKVAACSDRLYVTAKTAVIRATPGENGAELAQAGLGEEVVRSAVCDNNWSKISLERDGNKVNGYIQNQMLSDDIQIQPIEDQAEVRTDCSILDYPGRKDGEVVGEVLELDEVKLTFEEEALEWIAEEALKRDTGARALRAIIEEFMLDIMYEIPKDPGIGTVTITRAYLEKTGGPMIGMRGSLLPHA